MSDDGVQVQIITIDGVEHRVETIRCDQITVTPVTMSRKACAERWKRAQRPRDEDRGRPPSFDICQHCALGAARAGGVHVPRPKRAPTVREISRVERRWSRIRAFLAAELYASPTQVFEHLTANDDTESGLTPSIVRKELSGLRRAGLIARDGWGRYRHPAAPIRPEPAPEPPMQLSASQRQNRAQAARRWMDRQVGPFRPADLLAWLYRAGHPVPRDSTRAHQVVGELVRAHRHLRRIGRGLYVHAARPKTNRRALRNLKRAGVSPALAVVAGGEVLIRVDGRWQTLKGQTAMLVRGMPAVAVEFDQEVKAA